jgi:predicted amidohydrolase YtcJ
MFAFREFIDAGVRPASSSDYTASPAIPMMWLQAQVTRTDPDGDVWGPNQAITLEEALVCGTINGAYASREEAIKGTLEPGKLADLVVWDQDMFAVDPSALLDLKPERTMVGGRWVYEA